MDQRSDCEQLALQGWCDHPTHGPQMRNICPESCAIVQQYLTKTLNSLTDAEITELGMNMSSYGTSYFGKKKTKKINLELTRLQKKAKKLKIRITKKNKGKRIYKTITELKKNINKLNKKNKFGLGKKRGRF